MAAENVLDSAEWRLRSAEFGAVGAYHDGRPIVVMEFEPAERDRLDEWIWLRHLWLDLPPHDQILDAIDRGAGAKLLLRYAAIDWKHEAIRLQANSLGRQLVATWGAQLTAAFRQLLNDVPETEAGHFLRPLVKVDLVNDARLAFLPVARSDPHLPPEVQATWPRCDEQAAMYVIGGVIRDSCVGLDAEDATTIRTIVHRCLEPQSSNRYSTLEDLQTAWAEFSFANREGDRLAAWQEAQEGIGWLRVGHSRSALHAFRTAIHLSPGLYAAKVGRDRALAELGETRDALTPPQRREKAVSWGDVAEKGLRLEAEYEHAEALSLYVTVRMDGLNDADINAAIARCQLSLGASGHAIDYARRALAIDPTNPAAHSVNTRGHLLVRRYADALRLADNWLAVDPDDASAHYARGRGLFALGRFVEARGAFDRACSLRPQMLEAMLLRREADRSMKRVATNVGTSRPMTLDVPDHLAELRDALVSGRVQDAIPVLERPEYDDDAVAKLVHAECLAFAQRFDEAIAMYDLAAALSPDQRPKAVIGKVYALLSVERAAEALAELDGARDSVDVDLVELRGLVLRRLGLNEDAERELGRVVAASGSRSDLRVGRR